MFDWEEGEILTRSRDDQVSNWRLRKHLSNICIYKHMIVFVYICECVWISTYICMCVQMFIPTYIYIYIYWCVRVLCICKCTYTFMCRCTYMFMCPFIYTSTCVGNYLYRLPRLAILLRCWSIHIKANGSLYAMVRVNHTFGMRLCWTQFAKFWIYPSNICKQIYISMRIGSVTFLISTSPILHCPSGNLWDISTHRNTVGS